MRFDWCMVSLPFIYFLLSTAFLKKKNKKTWKTTLRISIASMS